MVKKFEYQRNSNKRLELKDIELAHPEMFWISYSFELSLQINHVFLTLSHCDPLPQTLPLLLTLRKSDFNQLSQNSLALRVPSHWALAGIAKNRYSTHSLAKLSTHFCIANANAIAKSSVWTELKTQRWCENDPSI